MTFNIVQIHWYTNTTTGEFFHRIEQPAKALNATKKFSVQTIHLYHPMIEQLVAFADLVILHMLYQPEVMGILQIRKQLGKPTIFEIADNFLQPAPWLPKDSPHRNPVIRQNILHYASQCDGLQLSSPFLTADFERVNPNIAILRNQIQTPIPQHQKPKGFTLGWGGSQGHRDDLEFFAPTIVDFCRSHTGARFAYMGYQPYFDSFFSQIPAQQKQYHPGGSIDSYFSFLDELHVGLALLQDTKFNLCRSDVKFLEYAAHGVCPVLSAVGPYLNHNEHSLQFTTPQELRKSLEKLYLDRDQLHQIANRARNHVQQRRTPQHLAEEREAFYLQFLPPNSVSPKLNDVPPSPQLEQLISEAKTHFLSKEYPKAISYLKIALKHHESYELAHLWMMKCLHALGFHEALLDVYEDYTPGPMYGDLIYEMLYLAAEKDDPLSCDRYFNGIQSDIRKLYLKPMQAHRRETIFREILKQKRFDYHALTGLIDLLSKRRRERQGELPQLLERALFIHPESQKLQNLHEQTHA